MADLVLGFSQVKAFHLSVAEIGQGRHVVAFLCRKVQVQGRKAADHASWRMRKSLPSGKKTSIDSYDNKSSAVSIDQLHVVEEESVTLWHCGEKANATCGHHSESS